MTDLLISSIAGLRTAGSSRLARSRREEDSAVSSSGTEVGRELRPQEKCLICQVSLFHSKLKLSKRQVASLHSRFLGEAKNFPQNKLKINKF